MTTQDINALCLRYSSLKVVAVHMEAWNHCRLSRKDLINYININIINTNVLIPQNGEELSFEV
ncbi:hypothetical protein [Clostridium sp.]